jgi:hypothetical protein
MKNQLVVFVVLISIFSCKTQIKNLPDRIKDLPIGFEVRHNPDTVYAEPDPEGKFKYIWKMETSVKSLIMDLEITEFGAYNLIGNKWLLANYTGKAFTKSDFMDWYSCSVGVIKKDETYTDKQNWKKSNELTPGKALWYYIGKSKDNKLYVGYAEIVTMGKLK